MRRQLLIAVALLAGAGGCYRPSFADCAILCGPGYACPSGESCVNGLCSHGRQCACTPASCAVSGTSCDSRSESCTDFFDCTISCGSDGDCASTGICQNQQCTHKSNGAHCACAAAACAKAGKHCDATGDCVPCPLLPTSDTRPDVYVGSDPAAVSLSLPYCPYASITAALKAVVGSGPVTIYVSPGVYDAAHGEKFPIVVRGPVTLAGAGETMTIIEGNGVVDHTLDQGTFNSSSQQATLQVGDATQTVRLYGMTVRTGQPGIINDTYGIFCDRGNAPPLGSAQTVPGNTIVSGVTVGPGYHTSIVVTNSASSGCNLSLTGSTLSGSGRGVWVLGCGLYGVSNGPAVAATIGDGMHGNVFTAIRGTQASTIDLGIAITMWDCTQSVIVQGNQISDSGFGFVAGYHTTMPALIIDGNRFSNLAASAISVDNSVIINELSNNVFQGVRGGASNIDTEAAAIAIHGSTQVLKARGNQLLANNTGVFIDGAAVSSARVIDFGTSSDQGNNVFRCNSRLDGNYGFDVWTQVAGGAGSLSFSGNQWDHLPPTGATSLSAANGTDVVNTSAAPAPMVVTAPSALATVPCPPKSMTVE